MSKPDIPGPIDILVIELSLAQPGLPRARELWDLVEHETVRLYDLVVVEKRHDGSCVEIDLADPSPGRLHDLRAFWPPHR